MTDQALKQATLGRLLDQAVAAHPGNDAIIYVDRDFRLNYREFGDLVDRLAKGLMALGVEKNEKVAVWATNVPYWVALQFATARIGATSRRMIVKKIRAWPAPSIFAASSIDAGIVLKKPYMRNVFTPSAPPR